MPSGLADLPFVLGKLAAALILPPLGPWLLCALGLLIMHTASRRWRRAGCVIAWSGLLLSLALATPAVVGPLLARIEPLAPISAEALQQAQAIVVLGGGRRAQSPEYGGADSVGPWTLERLRYAARLARRSGLPVLVSGGAPGGGLPEAVLMRETLEQDFGVAVRWWEDRSRNTAENARFSAAMLKADGIERIALVTHAAHMPRAVAEFRAQGLSVAAAPTAWMGGGQHGWLSLLPGPASAHAGWFALHELLGGLARRLRMQ